MMELIDKATALGQIDARDLFAIADAHGGGQARGGAGAVGGAIGAVGGAGEATER